MAKPAVAKKIEEEVKKVAPITVSRFGLEAQFNQAWRVNVPMGITHEDTMNEGFWQHLSNRFTPGDTVIVMPDDMAWRQILHVAEAGKNYAYMQQLELYKFESATTREEPPSEYRVDYGGSHHKWRVILGDRMLKDGFETRSLAARWAGNHEAARDR